MTPQREAGPAWRPTRVYRRAWTLWLDLVQTRGLNAFVTSNEWHETVSKNYGVSARSHVLEYTNALAGEGLIDKVYGGFFLQIGHAFGNASGSISPCGFFNSDPDGNRVLVLPPDRCPGYESEEAWNAKWAPKTTDEILEEIDEQRNSVTREERAVQAINGAWYFYLGSTPPGTNISREDWRIKLAVAEILSVVDERKAKDEGYGSCEERLAEISRLAAEMGLIRQEEDGSITFLRPPRRTQEEPQYRPHVRRWWRNHSRD